MSELFVIETYIVDKLRSDEQMHALVANRVFTGDQDTGEAFPWIRVSMSSPGTDTGPVGAKRLYAHPLYLVEAIGRGNGFGAIDSIVTRIDELLELSSGVTDKGTVYAIQRESPYSMIEVSNNVRFYHRGGLYRVMVKAA